MCEYPQGPEEEVGSPRAGVAGSCGLPAVENMGAGEGGMFSSLARGPLGATPFGHGEAGRPALWLRTISTPFLGRGKRHRLSEQLKQCS